MVCAKPVQYSRGVPWEIGKSVMAAIPLRDGRCCAVSRCGPVKCSRSGDGDGRYTGDWCELGLEGTECPTGVAVVFVVVLALR